MLYLLYILIALAPGIFWLIFYQRKDSEEPEPKRLVLKIFVWGMLATIPAAFLEYVIDLILPYAESLNISNIALGTFLVVAPIEEYFKYLVVKRKIYPHPEFNERLDGIIYGTIAGLGFASLENIMAALGNGPSIIVYRFATATLMHALSSGILGYYIGRARFNPQREKSLIRRGLLIAILIHGTYNLIIALGIGLTVPFLSILLIGTFITLNQLIKFLKKRRAHLLGKAGESH